MKNSKTLLALLFVGLTAVGSQVISLGSGGGGSGDVTGPGSSTDGGIVLFDGTGGDTLKQATGSGVVKATSGVYSAAALVNADVDAAAAIDASKIADGSVSSTEFQYINSLTSNAQTQINAKFTNSMATDRILGRTTGGSGAVEELTAGRNLSLAAGTLNLDSTLVDNSAVSSLDLDVRDLLDASGAEICNWTNSTYDGFACLENIGIVGGIGSKFYTDRTGDPTINNYQIGAIEAQVDADPKAGMYLMTGSAAYAGVYDTGFVWKTTDFLDTFSTKMVLAPEGMLGVNKVAPQAMVDIISADATAPAPTLDNAPQAVAGSAFTQVDEYIYEYYTFRDINGEKVYSTTSETVSVDVDNLDIDPYDILVNLGINPPLTEALDGFLVYRTSPGAAVHRFVLAGSYIDPTTFVDDDTGWTAGTPAATPTALARLALATDGDAVIDGGLEVSGIATGLVTSTSGVLGSIDSSTDFLTQYLLLAGRSGGQTATGGTAASNNLILRSTSNGTKGQVYVDETTASTSTTTGALRVGGGVGVAGGVYAAGALTSETSLVLQDPGAGTNKYTVAAPTLAADRTLTFPAAAPTANQVLYSTDTSGTLGWKAEAGAKDWPSEASNYTLTATVAANALTIALKDKAGSDPSGSTCFGFRSATAATGTYTQQCASAATSLVISSGSTMGQLAATAETIYVYAIYSGSAVVLGATTSPTFSDNEIATSTAEGGAGAADSRTGFYSTAAQTSKAVRLIGKIVSTQATPGTWATSPSLIQLLPVTTGPVYASYTSNAGQSFTSGNTIIVDFEDKEAGAFGDTHNAVTVGASWKFTAPMPLLCDIAAGNVFDEAGAPDEGEGFRYDLYLNNSLYRRLQYFEMQASPGSIAVNINGAASIPLGTGDFIDIRINQDTSSTLSLDTTATRNWVKINCTKVNGD